MTQPSIWKQLSAEQDHGLHTFEAVGLTPDDDKLVFSKRNANRLHGVTRADDSTWQVRCTLNHRQHILFVSRSLGAAAFMRDLIVEMLTRYPHCAPKYSKLPVKREDDNFNLPLLARTSEKAKPEAVVRFLQRIEKLLLDNGILYPLTPEEAAARDQIALQSSKQANTSAQLRYQKRRSTQLDEVFGQIKSVADTCKKMDELRARLCDWVDRKDAALDTVSQQVEFMTGQFESLKQAVEKNTATFQRLIDEARSHKAKNT